ncbi:MAG: hypothetical protein AAGJ74_05130 [Pseudomonadota bacterium]
MRSQRRTQPTDPPIAAGLWYPTEAAGHAPPSIPFRRALALAADRTGAPLPLIVISHGAGGWMGGHAYKAMALSMAGYAVMALEHPGNKSADEGAMVTECSVPRPTGISAVHDYMSGAWRGGGLIDATRIGFLGLSASGYGADRRQRCARYRPRHRTLRRDAGRIRLSRAHGGEFTPALEAQITPHAGDPCLGALAPAARGLGFAFAANRLAEIDAPELI